MNENEKNCDTGADIKITGNEPTRSDGCTLNSNIVPVDNGQSEYLSV
jgi:hypothetical protein